MNSYSSNMSSNEYNESDESDEFDRRILKLNIHCELMDNSSHPYVPDELVVPFTKFEPIYLSLHKDVNESDIMALISDMIVKKIPFHNHLRNANVFEFKYLFEIDKGYSERTFQANKNNVGLITRFLVEHKELAILCVELDGCSKRIYISLSEPKYPYAKGSRFTREELIKYIGTQMKIREYQDLNF